VKTLLIKTSTHGRVVVREAESPRVILVGFHGYMENADVMMERLLGIPGSEQWTLVSVQALNRFYKGRTQEVVAGWMTRQDREAAIADNIQYVNRVVEAVAADVPLFYAGFSQGAAMAFRAAVRGTRKASGVIAAGGDVPPELLEDAAAVFPPVLLARGGRDEWYTAAKFDADVAALETRGVDVEAFIFNAGHEWTGDLSAAAAQFIRATPVSSGGGATPPLPPSGTA
jgi:predicted esterase